MIDTHFLQPHVANLLVLMVTSNHIFPPIEQVVFDLYLLSLRCCLRSSTSILLMHKLFGPHTFTFCQYIYMPKKLQMESLLLVKQ